jgi:hypothetical protein
MLNRQAINISPGALKLPFLVILVLPLVKDIIDCPSSFGVLRYTDGLVRALSRHLQKCFYAFNDQLNARQRQRYFLPVIYQKMASTDPLLLLRASIAASNPPKLTTSSTPDTAAANLVDTLPNATHLYFSSTPAGPQCHDLSSPTRFISTTPAENAVDLRSVYFAWQQKDQTVPEYIAAASELQKNLPEGQSVRHLVFVERIDLLTWLEGASDESEYIKLFEGDSGAGEAKAAAAAVPTVSGTGVGVTQQSASGKPVKVIDARLQEIYNGERKMGDRNTVLRGIKPTVYNAQPRPVAT